MADVISLILTAKNDASKTITQVEKDIQKLSKSMNSVSNVDKTISAIGTGLAIGAFAATAKELMDVTAAASQAGASLSRLRTSFQDLATQNGTSGNEIFLAIDKITQGTLSQSQIMEQANAAMLLGVANTGKEFETLAKIAVDRGRAMGIGMEYAFESIVKGVGRLSPLILDNLGIVIDADKTYAEYAKTIGKTADQLTDLEKRQALISRLEIEVADFDLNSVNDAMSAWEKFSAAQQNATAAAGEWLNKNGFVIESINALTTALNIFAGNTSDDPVVMLKGLEEQLKKTSGAAQNTGPIREYFTWLEETGAVGKDDPLLGFLEDLTNQIDGVNFDKIQAIREEIKKLKEAIALEGMEDKGAKRIDSSWELYKATQDTNAELAMMEEYVDRVAKQLGGGKEEAKGLVSETIKTAGSLQAAIPALNDLIEGLRVAKENAAAMVSAINGAQSGFMSAVMGAFDASGFDQSVIDAAKQTQVAFDQALASIENAGYSLYDTEAAVMIVEREASSAFLAITDSINEAERATGGVSDATKTLTKDYQNLQGIVEGLLSSATADIGGLDLDSILPREDAINENARRLAAIANEGLINQPWLEEFKQEAPGVWGDLMLKAAMGTDVKTAAAQILRNFQDGLRPDLIDKGKLKEIAKRMFVVDQETKALVDEVATELANEMGISIEEARKVVGSAAGVKRELTAEEKQAIVDEKLAGLKAFVGFDFGEKKDAIQPGIDKGILDKDGNMVFNAKINFDTSSYPVTLAAFTTPQENADGSTPEATGLSIAPTIDTSSVTAQIADLSSSIGAMEPVVVPITFDSTTADASAKDTFAKWANGFLNPENVSLFGVMFSTSFANALIEQSPALNTIGMQTGAYIFDGFVEHGTGAAIAGELATQLLAAQSGIESSALSTGRIWGETFLSIISGNVPMQLVSILTDLITPEVINAIRLRQSQTGAQ